MIKVFSILTLCLPLWGQGNTLTFQGTDSTSTGIMKVVEGPVTSEDSAHQTYRLALADFALLITKGPITVDALEAAFEKIDAAKMKWAMSKGASVDLGSVPKSNGTTWTVPGPNACIETYVDGKLMSIPCQKTERPSAVYREYDGRLQDFSDAVAGKPHFTPIRPGDLPPSNVPGYCKQYGMDINSEGFCVYPQGRKEYSSPSYIDSEGNIMRNGMLQGRDLPKPSIDRSDAKSISRVKIEEAYQADSVQYERRMHSARSK